MKQIIIYILLSSCVVFGGTIDPKNTDKDHIDLAQKKMFDCVAPLISKNNNKITSMSSCVIIKPNYALTAAHIFTYMSTDDNTFYILANNELYLVEKIIPHHLFKSNKIGFNDIAICKIDNKIELKQFPKFYKIKNELKKRVYICGYGMTGTFDTGSTFSDGKKRAGTNLIDSITNHTLICSPSSHNRTNLEFLIAHGDSGGGMFINNKLVGINSYVYTNDGEPDSSWKDTAGHTRITLFLDWIEQNTK